MSWLTPLGFLGLLGLIVLILIYIIKPNYQNKIISSTFVWKLSLKYKKNKIPLSKFRNILLFLCQVFIITAAAFMLAQPFFADEEEVKMPKKVFILDASASMMADTDGDQTRFERAIDEIQTAVDETLQLENSEVSIILANDKASFLIQRATALSKGDITTALDELLDTTNGSACTYATPDIEGAIKLAGKITAVAPDVEVVLYTDTNYIEAGKVTVKNMCGSLDWNAAILDARMILFENRYTIEVDVACYGMNKNLPVHCTVEGVDNAGNAVAFTVTGNVLCRNDDMSTLEILPTEDNKDLMELASYKTVTVFVDEDDSLEIDNSFRIFGGEKLPLRIQYCSPNPNNYFSTAFRVIREKLKYRWNIEFDEVVINPEEETPDTAFTGYDIYIFETIMPETLPTDGISILANPTAAPLNAGFRLGMERLVPPDTYLTEGEMHPITDGVHPEEILVTKYVEILNPDANYIPLLYCGTEPMLLATNKNESEQKVVILPFSLNFSNLPIVLDFPLMMYNIVEYYMPSTITEYVFDVNEEIDLNARAEQLSLQGPNGINAILTEFPNKFSLTVPGVYEVSQPNLSGELVSENFFVKIPASESNIVSEEDSLTNPYYMTVVEEEEVQNRDIIFYIAIAMVALLFAEWWLHTREQY